MNDEFSKSSAVPGETYRKVAAGAAKAIRELNPDRLIIADGNSEEATLPRNSLTLMLLRAAEATRLIISPITKHHGYGRIPQTLQHPSGPALLTGNIR